MVLCSSVYMQFHALILNSVPYSHTLPEAWEHQEKGKEKCHFREIGIDSGAVGSNLNSALSEWRFYSSPNGFPSASQRHGYRWIASKYE